PRHLHSLPTRRSSDLSPNSSACPIRSTCTPCSRRLDSRNPIHSGAGDIGLRLLNTAPVRDTSCVMTHSTPVPKPYSPSFTSPKRSEEHTSELQSRGHL